MSTDPCVSVVIIFRDAERFLDEAISSVYAQTCSDWEMLLVDDGSIDGSAAHAAAWASRDPDRVRCLAHPGGVNRGMSASRNLGIRHAKGEYLAFLDADDVLFSNALADQVAVLDDVPSASMVYGPIQWWYGWTGQPEDAARDFVEDVGVPADQPLRPPTLVSLFIRNKAAVPSGMLVRRAVAEHVGGFEDSFRGEYEDQVFGAKICLESTVFAASRCWYRYRQHPDSCVAVSQASGGSGAARLVYLRWLAAYLARRRITHLRVWYAVSYELWRWGHPQQYRLWRRIARRATDALSGGSHRLAEMTR